MLNGGQAVVDHIGVGAVGAQHKRAVQAGGVAADHARCRCAVEHGADLLGVARVHIRVIGQHIAACRRAVGAVVNAAGFDGGTRVGPGDRRVVGAAYGDGQRGIAGKAARVGNAEREGVGQRVGGQAQALDGVQVVVEGVGIGAVGFHAQGAEQAGHVRAGGGHAAGARCAARAHAADLQHVVVVGVGVARVQQVATGVDRAGAVRRAARFNGYGGFVVGRGRVVGATDGDGQQGGVEQAARIGDLIGEGFVQGFARRQGLHRGIGVVRHIGVLAIGQYGQGAVGAHHRDRRAAAVGHRRSAGARAGPGHRQLFTECGAVYIRRVLQQVAHGRLAAAGIAGAAGFHGKAHFISGHRRIVLPHDADAQFGRVGQATIGDGVGEIVDQGIAGGAQGLHGGVPVVHDVVVRAVGIQRQRAVQALKLAPHSAARAGAGFASGAYVDDGKRVAVRVDVVDRDVAAGVLPGGAVRGAALFNGDADHCLGHGRVLHAMDDDGQGGAGLPAHSILQGVDEVLGHRGVRPQRDQRGVQAVDLVAVFARLADVQRAVLAQDGTLASARHALVRTALGADLADDSRRHRVIDIAVHGAVAVRVGLIKNDVAARVQRRADDRVVHRVHARGVAVLNVVHGDRVVVGAVDGDDDVGHAVQAARIGGGVLEHFGQRLAYVQRLHNRVGVVQHIAVGAVRADRQYAIAAGNSGAVGRRAAHGHRHDIAEAIRQHRTRQGDRARIARVHVGVIVQHGPLRIAATRAVVRAALFGGLAHVVARNRRIIGAPDGDDQAGGADGPGHVAQLIRKGLGQRRAGCQQLLHQGVVVVQLVFVGAHGAHDQGAVQPDQRAGRARRHGLRCAALPDLRDAQRVLVGLDVHVQVVGQHVATRVDAGRAIAGSPGFNGRGRVVHALWRIVDGIDGDGRCATGAEVVVCRFERDAIAVRVATLAQVIGADDQGIVAVVVGVRRVLQRGQRGVQRGLAALQRHRATVQRATHHHGAAQRQVQRAVLHGQQNLHDAAARIRVRDGQAREVQRGVFVNGLRARRRHGGAVVAFDITDIARRLPALVA